MKARAAVAWEPKKPLQIEEVEVEGPREGEVLLKVHASGVCHTDAFTLSGEDPEGAFPAILGHEGGCEVLECGPGVKTLKPGDHVIPLYIPECQEPTCAYCSTTRNNLCQSIAGTVWTGFMPDGTRRFKAGGKDIYHYMGCSTFSEYTVVPEIALAKINVKAPLDMACLLGCGVTTGIGAVLNTARVEPGSSVAVFGLGTVGLSVIQGAVMAKAERIIAIDINPGKEEIARKLGATDFVNSRDIDGSIPEYIQEMTGGGVDYSFDCTGIVQVMRDALECTHMGWGTSCIIGVAGAGEEIKTRPFNLVVGRRWIGTAFGGVKGRSELPGMVDQYMDGNIELDSLVTHTMGLEEINTAFDLMHEGKSIKSVILF